MAAGVAPAPDSTNESTLIFLGGWESDHTPPAAQKELACAWYPFEDSEKNRALYGTLAL